MNLTLTSCNIHHLDPERPFHIPSKAFLMKFLLYCLTASFRLHDAFFKKYTKTEDAHKCHGCNITLNLNHLKGALGSFGEEI